ncbi:unnamed protein product [Effrenium voratum]|nr:unnamed protein product [Effrenium voratum]
MLRPYGPGPVHRVPRPALRGRRIAQLPSWKEFREGTQDQRLKYKRISLKDGSIAHELHRAEAKDWRIAVVPAGHVVAGTGEEALWQLRPPPALRALYSTGVIKQEEYLNILRSMTGPTRKAELEASAPSQAEPGRHALGAVAVLLLGAGRAALGLLRGLDVQASSKTMPKGWELEEHKVLRTYAVRGNEKQGTGRFQLYEDAKKRGYGGRSEGAQLRRRNAIRFFEKINEKFQDWGLEIRRQNKEHGPQGLARGWPPSVVFFAGDLRLRKMLLDCKKPPCPLPDTKLWIKVPGPLAEMDPTLEALQRAAGFLCSGEVAEVCNQEEKKVSSRVSPVSFAMLRSLALCSKALTKAKPAAALQSHQKDAALGKVAKGLQGDLQSAASGYREAMKGASSGTAYAPDSPILSQVVGPRPRPETHVQPATVSEPKELSLAELKDLPSKDLQAMLKQRGVTHNASDKDSLANWVHQHQHLPHVKVEAARSLQQLQQLPVAELRDMLQERGVEEGSATEKAELARWVWQHQHLPILHEMDPRRQRKTGGFGYGCRGREPEPEQKEEEKLQLEAEEVGKLEGESPKLLEGETSAPARRWPWVLAASAAAVVLLVGGIAANDLRQVEESAICRWLLGMHGATPRNSVRSEA